MSGWLLLALPAGLLGLLAIPLDLGFAYRRGGDQPHASCAVAWLFGAIRLRLCPRPQAGRRRRKAVKRQARAGGRPRRLLTMLRARGFPGRLVRLARDLLRCLHVRRLSLDVRLGLDDPADTGRLWGLVAPLASLLAPPPRTRIAITPDFTAQVFEMECRGQVRIVPLQLLAFGLLFLLSPTLWRALGTQMR